jgi:hypothetical protein
MRYAAKVDENQALIVDALRKAGATVWIIGLPVDLLIGCNGVTALAEVKRIEGKRKPRAAGYTDLQREFMATWRGGTVATLTDVEGALRLVSMLKGLPHGAGPPR